MTTTQQDANFLADTGLYRLLETAVEWIQETMRPEEVFETDALREWAEQEAGMVDEDEAIDFVRDHFTPDQVFPADELTDWALENGFIVEE